MATGKMLWIGPGLALGSVLVLAGPAWLVWNAVRPEPFTAQTLRARFQSARFEAAALIFTYRVENRTRRSAYLAPDITKILVRLAKGRPPVGEASVDLPLELEPHSSQILEVKLGLPRYTGTASIDTVVGRSLESLDGFELVNERKGLRLLLPRGW
jgi:hypothetical protein